VDGLTFVDHLIGHLMWPVITVIVLVAFYPVLRDRLGGLVRVKVGPGGVEGEFAGVLKESDRIMAEAPVPPPSRNVVEDHERSERIAAISPRAAVLEAFTVVDNTLKERLLRFGVVPDASEVSAVRSTDAIVEAERIGLLDQASVEVWKNLRALSNTARHESGIAITKEQALDYGRLAAQMLTTIQHAVPSRPPAAGKPANRVEPRGAGKAAGAAGPAAKGSRRATARPPGATSEGPSTRPARGKAASPVAAARRAPTTRTPDRSNDDRDDPIYDPVNSPS
jgi:hypothetical protein